MKIAELENFKQSAVFQSAKSRRSEIREEEDEDISFINDNGQDEDQQMSPPNDAFKSNEFELKDQR